MPNRRLPGDIVTHSLDDSEYICDFGNLKGSVYLVVAVAKDVNDDGYHDAWIVTSWGIEVTWRENLMPVERCKA